MPFEALIMWGVGAVNQHFSVENQHVEQEHLLKDFSEYFMNWGDVISAVHHSLFVSKPLVALNHYCMAVCALDQEHNDVASVTQSVLCCNFCCCII